MTAAKTALIDGLVEIGAIKFGNFTLKSGLQSPIYIDLRLTISYPGLLQAIAGQMAVIAANLEYDRIAGIPYTALPIATAFSLQTGKPMIYNRKEVKTYGTARQIEGVWNSGERALIVDDLITDGGSKFEIFSLFEKEGLTVRDVIVLIDREQGGKERLQKEGYQLFSIISIFEILDRMRTTEQISEASYHSSREFLQKNR